MPTAVDGRVGQLSQPTGRLLYLVRGDIWQLDVETRERRLFLDVGPSWITHLAHSPDRRRLAYSVLHFSPTYRITGSEIVVAEADGSNPWIAVQEEGARVAVKWPSWDGWGSALTYTTTNLVNGSEQVEEVELTTGSRTVLVAGGSSPTQSPDGQWLVYNYPTNRGWSIWSLHRPTGGHRQLVAETWFLDADVPTFSPDGASVTFVAAGDGPPAGSGASSAASSGSAPLHALLGLLGRQLVGVASAHEVEGAEFDLWSVRPDGSDVRRVARLANEQAYLSWSFDGRYVAVWGRKGLQMVEVATGGVSLLDTEDNSGPISWGW